MASDGILGTAVSWDAVEADLRSAFGTPARLGANKSVQDIGDGLVSCCGLITCDWEGAAAGENLPRTVFIKIPSTAPLVKLNASLPPAQRMYDGEKMKEWERQIEGMHNTEVATYDFLASFDDLSLPKKICGKPITDGEVGHICLEYKENTRTMNFYEEHTVEQLKQIARALGKIQACSLKKKPINPEFDKDFFSTLTDAYTLEALQGAFKAIHTLDSSEKTKELLDKIEAILPHYHASKLGAGIFDEMDFPRVLVNGDAHAGNMLVDKDSRNLVAIVDWQCTHLGLGVEDLHRIIITSLTAEERRASTPMLVEEMYNSMVQNLDGAEPPYSLDKLLVLSDLMFMPVAIFLMSRAVPMVKRQDRNLEISDEERACRKGVLMNKVLGCLEDIVEFDVKYKTLADELLANNE